MEEQLTPEQVEELEEEIAEDEAEDEVSENMETQKDLQEELEDVPDGSIPEQEESHNTIKFLKDILSSEDRFKTANLTWDELGKPTFSTRFWINLANTCDQLFGYMMVKKYCLMKARITSDTSLSREGFIIQTAVTSKRIREKRGGFDPSKLQVGKK